MKTPTIEITIAGPQGCGKTQLLRHLEDLLHKHPFWAKGREASMLRLSTHSLGETPVVIEPPAPATIPLGENVTRSGLRARVLSNDSAGEYPVVAEVQKMPGSRLTLLRRYKADGTSRADSKLDLVVFDYHEIKAPGDTELEDLRRWKAKMKPILEALNLPEIGKEIGETGSIDTAREILPCIRELKAKLETAKQALQ